MIFCQKVQKKTKKKKKTQIFPTTDIAKEATIIANSLFSSSCWWQIFRLLLQTFWKYCISFFSFFSAPRKERSCSSVSMNGKLFTWVTPPTEERDSPKCFAEKQDVFQMHTVEKFLDCQCFEDFEFPRFSVLLTFFYNSRKFKVTPLRSFSRNILWQRQFSVSKLSFALRIHSVWKWQTCLLSERCIFYGTVHWNISYGLDHSPTWRIQTWLFTHFCPLSSNCWRNLR